MRNPCDRSLEGERAPEEVGGRRLHAACAVIYFVEERLTEQLKTLTSRVETVEYRT